jgi:hypothetical protein
MENGLGYLIAALAGVIFTWLFKKNKLPRFLQEWLQKRLDGGDTIEEMISRLVIQADKLEGMAGEERKDWVKGRLKEAILPTYGPIGAGILDALVEYVYQKYKKRV